MFLPLITSQLSPRCHVLRVRNILARTTRVVARPFLCVGKVLSLSVVEYFMFLFLVLSAVWWLSLSREPPRPCKTGNSSSSQIAGVLAARRAGSQLLRGDPEIVAVSMVDAGLRGRGNRGPPMETSCMHGSKCSPMSPRGPLGASCVGLLRLHKCSSNQSVSAKPSALSLHLCNHLVFLFRLARLA